MFGYNNPQPVQPAGRMSWDEYLKAIQEGPAPQYTPATNAQSPASFTAAGINEKGSPGGILGALFGGGGGMSGTSRIPATPIDYSRIHSILNSGVLTGGKAPVTAPPPAAAPPPAPAPAPPPKRGGILDFLSGIGL